MMTSNKYSNYIQKKKKLHIISLTFIYIDEKEKVKHTQNKHNSKKY